MSLLAAAILRGTHADRPTDNTAATEGRLFYETDTHLLFRDNGTGWDNCEGAASSGDVAGPASSTDGHLAVFDGNDGKKIKDGGAPSAKTNLITNGYFGTDTTGWSAESPATVSQSSGQMVVSRNSAGASALHSYQDVTVVSGKIYLIGLKLITRSNGVKISTVQGAVEAEQIYLPNQNTVSDPKIFFILATSTTIRLVIRATESASATVTVDDVFMVEA